MHERDSRVVRPESIVFIHSSDELYGADRMLMAILDALPTDLRASSEVWLPTDLPHVDAPLCAALEEGGVRVRHVDLPIMRRSLRTPRGLLGLAGRAVRLRTEIRRRRPHAVYCTTSAAFLAAPVARLARVPLVVGHVQEFWSKSDRLVLAPAARATHRLLAISTAVRDSLPTRLAARTTLVLNAVPDPGPDPTHATEVPRDQSKEPLTFLVASRWNAWKGHRSLLRAWDLLDRPGRLLVLGSAPAAGDAVDVNALRETLRHPESVTVVGQVPDPDPYLREADVVVVPSESPEPFGLVTVEAFARSRPVVGTRAGGLEEIVTDGVDGWLYPPGDAVALAALLDRLDPAVVRAAGARARATYEERFTEARYRCDWRAAMGIEPEAS